MPISFTYKDYLDVKKAVLEEDATVNYVSDKLQIPTLLARCILKDWHEQNEKIEGFKSKLDNLIGTVYEYEPEGTYLYDLAEKYEEVISK